MRYHARAHTRLSAVAVAASAAKLAPARSRFRAQASLRSNRTTAGPSTTCDLPPHPHDRGVSRLSSVPTTPTKKSNSKHAIARDARRARPTHNQTPRMHSPTDTARRTSTEAMTAVKMVSVLPSKPETSFDAPATKNTQPIEVATTISTKRIRDPLSGMAISLRRDALYHWIVRVRNHADAGVIGANGRDRSNLTNPTARRFTQSMFLKCPERFVHRSKLVRVFG